MTITTFLRAPRPPRVACRPAAAPLLALALLAPVAACDSAKSKDAAAGPRTDDALVAAWKKAGLDVTPLAPVDAKPFQATSCKGGTAGGVDVVLCTYDSGEDAHAAEDVGLATIGAATGASIAHGSRLLVVADRRKQDPGGTRIDAIVSAFKP